MPRAHGMVKGNGGSMAGKLVLGGLAGVIWTPLQHEAALPKECRQDEPSKFEIGSQGLGLSLHCFCWSDADFIPVHRGFWPVGAPF